MMEELAIFMAVLFGLLVGSFLNVVIYRIPVMLENAWTAAAKEQLHLPADDKPKFNLLTPPSRCGGCGAPVRPWQNIPIISWLILKGKCHTCKTPISIRYPLVELLTGVLFGVVAWQYGWTEISVWGCVLTAFVIAMTFIDADTQLLPDQLTLPLVWLGLLFNWHTGFIPLDKAVLGAVLGYMSLYTLYYVYLWIRKQEGLGFGDFKMLAALGAWVGVGNLAIIVFMSSLVGTIFALIQRMGMQQRISFGPCLAIAGWVVFLFHEKVSDGVNWWLKMSGF